MLKILLLFSIAYFTNLCPTFRIDVQRICQSDLPRCLAETVDRYIVVACITLASRAFGSIRTYTIYHFGCLVVSIALCFCFVGWRCSLPRGLRCGYKGEWKRGGGSSTFGDRDGLRHDVRDWWNGLRADLRPWPHFDCFDFAHSPSRPASASKTESTRCFWNVDVLWLYTDTELGASGHFTYSFQ